MAIDTTESHLLQCTEYIESPSGGVAYYLVKAISKDDGEVISIKVKPDELVSRISMKRILLGSRIFYSVSQRKHDENLKNMFEELSNQMASQANNKSIQSPPYRSG